MRISGLSLLCLVACGGSSSSPDAGPSAAMACADESHASCTKRDTCSPGFNNAHAFGDEMTCETRTAAACVAALGGAGTAQTPAHLEQCLAAFSSYSCADFFDINPPSACVAPMGAGAVGAACGASAQCASTYCAVTATTVCGTCQPLPAIGATCSINADCGRDLACATAPMATSGTCKAFVASGGACLTNVNPCGSGLSCVGDVAASSTPGACVASVATVGGACDGSRKTMPSCDAELGLSCIPSGTGTAVGTCQKVMLVGAGTACGSAGMPVTKVSVCEAGGMCVKLAPTDRLGMCVAAVADGAACDSDVTKGPPCLAPSKCVASSGGTAGICTAPNAAMCH